jgi:hypothetical protein
MNRIVASILLATTWFACYSIAKAGDIGPVEAELRRMLSIPIESLIKEPATDHSKLVSRTYAATVKARGYCSRKQFRVLTEPKLKDQAYIEQWWRLDYVSPDRWHVTQGVWEQTENDYATDEWVSIGATTFQNAGLWFKNHSPYTDNLNTLLLIDVFLDILKRVPPIPDKTYRTPDNKYLIITHALPFLEFNGNRVLEGCGMSEGGCEIQSWIDLQSGYFVRSTILTGERKPELEASQSFSCFNDDILIEPPAWLNAEPDSDGQLKITNTEVLIVPHHESPAR